MSSSLLGPSGRIVHPTCPWGVATEACSPLRCGADFLPEQQWLEVEQVIEWNRSYSGFAT